MATVAGIKIKAKAPRVVSSWSADEKHLGSEPVWDHDRALEMGDEQFNSFLRKSLNWYNYFYSQKDLKKYVVAWVKAHPKFFTEDDTEAYSRSADSMTPMTVCSLVKATTAGMPLHEKHRDYLVEKITAVIANVDNIIEPVKKTASGKTPYVPTIQERIAEKVSYTLGEIEGQIDLVCANKPPTIKVYDHITAQKLPQSCVSQATDLIERKKAEMLEVKADKEQLKEAYSHYTKKDIDRIIAYYDSILSDLQQYAQVRKAQRFVRIKKAPSKDKLVAKLKYLAEDKTLKVVSIPPSTILGAQALWVFDTKTRKLFRYVADAHSGSLSVKGTSIVGFDTAKSVGKTVRKPEETIRELMRAGKVSLRTFLTSIKAVEVLANGRLNANQLLLRVE